MLSFISFNLGWWACALGASHQAAWLGPVLAPLTGMPSERADRMLSNITKGLLRYFYPEYDYARDQFSGESWLPIPKDIIKFNYLAPKLRHDTRGDGVFEVRHGIAPGNCGGAWIYLFYRAACFVTYHMKPEPELPEDFRAELRAGGS